MKILTSDIQSVFRIILVEKLRFIRPNWNIYLKSLMNQNLLTHLMQIITLLLVSKFYEKLHAYIEDIQMFLLNMSFISQVKWTIFIFHEW